MASLPSNPHQGHDLLVNSDLHERSKGLFHQVFGIDLLRENIINYAIHTNSGKLSRKTASTCRLVQRSWLESVTKCLKKSGQPLFVLTLMVKRQLSPDSLVNQFLKVYSSSSRVLESTPPFSLTVYCGDEIHPEDYRKVLEKCLRWCTDGLVSLELQFYSYDAQTLEIPKNLSLPALRKLTLWVSKPSGTEIVNVIRTCGVPEILAACKKLKDVCLVGHMSNPVILPGTVTQLELELSFSNLDQFAMDNANKCTKLTELTLCTPNASYDGNDSIFRILDLAPDTLKILKIKDGSTETDWQKVPIRFPIMKRLESCFVTADNWKWGEERITLLQNQLPAIKQITLRNLTPRMLQQLLENSRFETAEKVKLHVDTDDNDLHWNIHLPLTLTKLPQTFPNITIFDISLPIRNDTPTLLHPIFQGMPHLEVLCVSLYQDLDSVICDPVDFWIVMFLGMSIYEITPTKTSYISNMSELRVLKLSLEFGYTGTSIPAGVFEFGFLTMPKLLHLEVTGDLWVHSTMQRRWRAAGRSIESAVEDTDDDRGEDYPTFF